jgi:hypothetical protein
MKVVTGIAFLFLLTLSVPEGRSVSPALETQTVKYCDLVANPALYDGRDIRVTGTYSVIGAEVSRFFSSACDGASIWVEFNSDYQTCSNSKAVKSIAAMRKHSGFRWGRPHVTVITGRSQAADVQFVGRFIASNPYSAEELPIASPPFGPVRSTRAGYDFIFKVSCVERVKRLPKNAKY